MLSDDADDDYTKDVSFSIHDYSSATNSLITLVIFENLLWVVVSRLHESYRSYWEKDIGEAAPLEQRGNHEDAEEG